MMELGAVTFIKELILQEVEKATEKVTEKVTKEVTEKVAKEVTEKVTKEVTEKVKLDSAVKIYKDGYPIHYLAEALHLSADLIHSTIAAKNADVKKSF